MAYDNTNTGILNINDKGDNEKRPDYKGSVNIEGVDYWLSGWTRTAQQGDRAGQQFISLKAEKKKDAVESMRPMSAPQPVLSADNFDDDILFN